MGWWEQNIVELHMPKPARMSHCISNRSVRQFKKPNLTYSLGILCPKSWTIVGGSLKFNYPQDPCIPISIISNLARLRSFLVGGEPRVANAGVSHGG